MLAVRIAQSPVPRINVAQNDACRGHSTATAQDRKGVSPVAFGGASSRQPPWRVAVAYGTSALTPLLAAKPLGPAASLIQAWK